jgi:hypothetical protein
VFGPVIWLMFTEDGQRRTDTVVLWLFGEAEIKMDLKALTGRYTEQDMRKVYTDLNWQCQDQPSAYGDRHCVSRIGIFNGIPVKYLTVFYRAGQLTALKLHYRANNHNPLQSQLDDLLGEPEATQGSTTAPAPDEVLQWRTPEGLVLMKKTLIGDEEPALFWLSNELLVK